MYTSRGKNACLAAKRVQANKKLDRISFELFMPKRPVRRRVVERYYGSLIMGEECSDFATPLVAYVMAGQSSAAYGDRSHTR